MFLPEPQPVFDDDDDDDADERDDDYDDNWLQHRFISLSGDGGEIALG